MNPGMTVLLCASMTRAPGAVAAAAENGDDTSVPDNHGASLDHPAAAIAQAGNDPRIGEFQTLPREMRAAKARKERQTANAK